MFEYLAIQLITSLHANGQPHTYVCVLLWRADAHVAGLLRGIFQRLDKVSEEVKELKEASPM